jgi:hypothetical protein
MKDIIFRNCRIERVKWVSHLRKVSFIDCSIVDSDFSGAEFIDSGFVKGVRDNVRLPDHPRNFIISTATLLEAMPVLRRRMSPWGYEVYAKLAAIEAAQPTEEMMDFEAYDELSDADNGIVMEVLYEMRHSNRAGEHL